MSISRIPMTPNGAKALKETLDNIVKELNEVASEIAHAKGFGDLSENAEYTSAKQKQSFLMKRSQTISEKLRKSQIIDPKKLVKSGKVVFGSTIYLRNTNDESVLHLHIVGEDEADIKANKISFSSPIARAVIGKMKNDCVQVKTLEGIKNFEIQEVEYL